MAKRRSNRSRKMQPAITNLSYIIPAAGGTAGDPKSYVDTARSLSRINRRLYSQERMYAYQGLTFIWKAAAVSGTQTLSTIECTVKTAGNTWIVQNSYVKGRALWHQMQELVLEDNPSIKGKWHDFKLKLVQRQTAARQLEVMDGAGVPVLGGEWDASTFVMPQHEVDAATGLPLAAEEKTAALIGVDNTAGTIKSLTKAYAESRSTVQAPMPNVPAGMSTSFFNLLTDSGSQEPELADVIEDENDEPPYSKDHYPGADVNANVPTPVGYSAISASEVDGRIGGFVAPCGLLEIEITGYDQNGVVFPIADMPEIGVLLHVAPGMYKGVASVPMGQ